MRTGGEAATQPCPVHLLCKRYECNLLPTPLYLDCCCSRWQLEAASTSQAWVVRQLLPHWKHGEILTQQQVVDTARSIALARLLEAGSTMEPALVELRAVRDIIHPLSLSGAPNCAAAAATAASAAAAAAAGGQLGGQPALRRLTAGHRVAYCLRGTSAAAIE